MAIYKIMTFDGEFKDSFHKKIKFEKFENKQEILNYISTIEELNNHDSTYRINESKLKNYRFTIEVLDNLNNDYIPFLNIFKVVSLIDTLVQLEIYDLHCLWGYCNHLNCEKKEKQAQFYLEKLINRFGLEKLQIEFPDEILVQELILSKVNKILEIKTIELEKEIEEYQKAMQEESEKHSDELAEKYHNIQMESADEELRAWDSEDPSWRIAIDLD